MTNNWADLQNAKVFLIEGSNAAENHVMAMKWIRKAQEKGAKIIHVDPRFNRTSSIADIYARIRPGADIAFLSTVINYVLENKLYDEEYVKLHTNALLIANAEFGFDEDAGVFTGYDAAGHKYDTATWTYELGADKKPKKADSLDDPRTVFARLKKHFSRYTLEKGEAISGVPAAKIKEIAETFAANKPGTILYALGMTQHTVGIQNIRCYGILQMLLGNIGKAGGGVNALRGEPNVQGACDMSVLNSYVFGYLKFPEAGQATIADWTKGSGTFRRKFLVNGLKAWYGDYATKDNDFAYGYLPKKGKSDASVFGIIDDAYNGKMKFLWTMGQNPMVTNPNLNYVAEALAKLEMLVVSELWETETAAFWQRPGTDPKTVQTEVILLPAAYFMEKEGTITGSGRLVQWRYKAVNPPGEARADIAVIDEVFRRVRDLYKGSTDPKDGAILNMAWDYPADNLAEAVLQEISGKTWADVTLPDGKVLPKGTLVGGIGQLQADGSTSSGVWIYAGVFGGGKNLSKRRDNSDKSGVGMYPNFAWTWPGNIKVLYNRASCDAKGQPWPGTIPLIKWDEAAGKWVSVTDNADVPSATTPPDKAGAFRMNGEGVGRLMATVYKDPDAKEAGMPRDSSGFPSDGPFPEHYEPVESPTANAMHPAMQNNPVLKYPRVPGKQPIGTKKDFPYVLMTSSLAEHWCAGSTTRNVPWLNELSPEPFVELPEKLAGKLNVRTGEKVKVSSARGEVTVKAVVTKRMAVMTINGEETPVVYMPYNWGFKGLSTGPSTNVLTIDAGDPGAKTQETKACLVNVAKAELTVAQR